MLRIDFGARGNSAPYRRTGWYPSEQRHTWTMAGASSLELPRPQRAGIYLLAMTLAPFVWKDRLPVQQLTVRINGTVVATFALSEMSSIECRLPWSLLEGKETISVVFQHPNAAKPAEVNGVPDDRVIALAFERISLTGLADIPDASDGRTNHSFGEMNEEPLQELALRFENLGENCEFGLVQRRCGAEPLGLLRFSSTPLGRLIMALKAHFEGIGDPDLVEVRVSNNGQEYMVLDKKFGFLYHPWVKLGEADAAEIHRRECRRLPFLTRKLVEDLKSAEKIFVYKGMRPLADADVKRLLAAMREYGPTTLLWVALQEDDNTSGTVREIAPGLLKGYVDRFAPGENAHDLSFTAWIEVCRNASWLQTQRQPAELLA